jgi:hypothetical protein
MKAQVARIVSTRTCGGAQAEPRAASTRGGTTTEA